MESVSLFVPRPEPGLSIDGVLRLSRCLALPVRICRVLLLHVPDDSGRQAGDCDTR